MGLVLATAGGAGAMPVERTVRSVRLLQDVPELGLSAGVRMETDGALSVTATAGELAIRKQVYADGLTVAYGRDASVDLHADRDSDYDGKARRVRGWLARSDAVQRFRQINEVLERQDAVSPEALSLRVTGALLAELLGDPGAAQRLSRSITARLAQGFRKAQTGYTPSCWDTYQRLVMAAANALESCLNSFAVYNPMRNLCALVWTLQVESAWFQFLSCSSFPMK